ncbi:MAG: hypothetical protein LQ340_007323, partial [Diploschistes diacapsis]
MCNNTFSSCFAFLDLARKIRDQIYRGLVLPPSKRIHIGSWFNPEARDAYNAVFICYQRRIEISSILYSEAI